MILSEFVDKVFNRYKCTAPDISDKKSELMDLFITKCDKIDFQKLLTKISREHEGDFVPSCAKILDWSYSCYKNEFKKNYNSTIKQVAFKNTLTGFITRTDAFEGEWTEKQMLKWKTIQSGHNNWEVVEVYQ